MSRLAEIVKGTSLLQPSLPAACTADSNLYLPSLHPGLPLLAFSICLTHFPVPSLGHPCFFHATQFTCMAALPPSPSCSPPLLSVPGWVDMQRRRRRKLREKEHVRITRLLLSLWGLQQVASPCNHQSFHRFLSSYVANYYNHQQSNTDIIYAPFLHWLPYIHLACFFRYTVSSQYWLQLNVTFTLRSNHFECTVAVQ